MSEFDMAKVSSLEFLPAGFDEALAPDHEWPCGCVAAFVSGPTSLNPHGVVGEVHSPCEACAEEAA